MRWLKRVPKLHLVGLIVAFLFVIGGVFYTSPQEVARASYSFALDLPETAPSQQPPIEHWQQIQVKSGDNLSTIFKRVNLDAKTVHQVAQTNPKLFRKIHPKDSFKFLLDDAGDLQKLRLIKSPLESYLLSRDPTSGSYQLEHQLREPEVQVRFESVNIEDSLFLSAERQGLSQALIMRLASIFGWDIDFVLDIRAGDHFSFLWEEHFIDGKKIADGEILVASFTNQGRTYEAVRYNDGQGRGDFFTPDGKSLRKAFLRTPVDFTRISSRYNPNRLHPIFKTKRPHRGVDYAAPTGTPIKAAGDGKVIFAGWKGGYGRVVILQHGQSYSTLYAHMHRFNRKTKVGRHVKQGQIIGYVGATGYATGPHLHYEFRLNGVHRNPLTVRLPSADPIANPHQQRFLHYAEGMLAQLQNYQQERQLAAAGSKPVALATDTD